MADPRDRILVVDDEETMVHVLTRVLQSEGFEVEGACSADAARDRLRAGCFEVVITDLRLPDEDGLEVLRAAREHRPEAVVILITAFGTIESAIEAMRAGAYDYVTKPFRAGEIVRVVRKALEHVHLKREVNRLRNAVEERYGFASLVGKSARMKEIYTQIEKVSVARGAVLIQGESGTGKELVAKAIHFNGNRRAGPFVVIDCGAIPETLQESELFGHERGAFTGAIATRRGLFEEAHGGSVFLDEVADLAPGLQAKVLRVLQEGEIRRVGGSRSLHVDARVIAATNRDLVAEVREGVFREDLFYRLNVFRIVLPPLRDRLEDLPLLADHFLERLARGGGTASRRLSPDALRALMAYAWPGNVRELEHALERTALLCERDIITPADLPPEILAPRSELTVALPEPTPGGSDTLARALRGVEEQVIRHALARAGGNRTEAARSLGIGRRTLLYKLKEYGLGGA